MSLNLNDRLAVRPLIVPRCATVVATYAGQLLDNVNSTLSQIGWAREALRAPTAVAESVSYHVIRSQAYIDAGSGITDGDLEYLVITALNAHFITGA